MSYKVILASSSQTRKKILENYGIPVNIIPHTVDEQQIKEKNNLKPKELVQTNIINQRKFKKKSGKIFFI